MATSLAPVEIPPNTWIDLYASTGITVGVEITFQNVGSSEVITTESLAEPLSIDGHNSLETRKFFSNTSGNIGAWAFSFLGSTLQVEQSTTGFKPPGGEGVGGTNRVNYTLVQTVSDFPAPSGGIITLQTDFAYEINGTIILQNNTTIATSGSNTMFSLNREFSKIVGDNTGPVFTVTDSNLDVNNINVENTGGSIFTVTGSTSVLEFDNCGLQDFTTLGTADGVSRLAMENGSITNGTNGVTLSNTLDSAVIRGTFIGIDFTGTLLDLGTSDTAILEVGGNIILSANGMVLISGLTNGANISSGGIGRLITNNSIGPFTSVLTNITSLDDKWLFDGNIRFTDTPFTGSMFLQSNATSTNVLDGSYVKVAGTTTEGNVSKFSMTDDNEITYEDVKDIVVTINVNTSMVKSGGAQVYDVGIFKNNVLLSDSVTEIEIRNTASTVSVSVTDTLSQNDFVDIRIQGVGTADDVTVPSMQFIVNKL